MNSLITEALSFQAELEEYRCVLHANPEIGMETPETSNFIIQKLESIGYKTSCVSQYGVTTLAGGKKPGKTVLLRADMDALPIREDTDISCKSLNNNMHACGHDFHTAMLLGAAKLLKAHEDDIEGTVKLMFQPGEEVLLGAKTMIEDGILENPKVDAAMMIHVVTGYPIPTGTLIISAPGAVTAASDSFEIEIQGKGGHGAMPESTVDPLIIASHIHLALQEIRSREIAGNEDAVCSISSIQGGSSYNIIPDKVIMKGTLRTFNPKIQSLYLERIKTISESIAEAFRGKAEVRIVKGCPSALNNKDVLVQAKKIISDNFESKALFDTTIYGMTRANTSEDFSFVTQKVPSVVLGLSAGNSKEGYQYPLHNPKAKFDVNALAIGAAAYAIFALEWLNMNKNLLS